MGDTNDIAEGENVMEVMDEETIDCVDKEKEMGDMDKEIENSSSSITTLVRWKYNWSYDSCIIRENISQEKELPTMSYIVGI